MSECVCGAPTVCTARCVKHDRDLHGYPCFECGEEWRAANPRTAAVIARGSRAAIAAARKADAAAREAAGHVGEGA